MPCTNGYQQQIKLCCFCVLLFAKLLASGPARTRDQCPKLHTYRCSALAVRGEIVLLAQKMKKELESGKKYPFKKIVMCNIGNPQQLGQKPITFFRQVLALCDYPQVWA